MRCLLVGVNRRGCFVSPHEDEPSQPPLSSALWIGSFRSLGIFTTIRGSEKRLRRSVRWRGSHRKGMRDVLKRKTEERYSERMDEEAIHSNKNLNSFEGRYHRKRLGGPFLGQFMTVLILATLTRVVKHGLLSDRIHTCSLTSLEKSARLCLNASMTVNFPKVVHTYAVSFRAKFHL
jgi:hypothetical protein